MLKDLLLPMTATSGDESALSAAISLASRLDAHLTTLEMVNLPAPVTNPWGLTPEPALLSLYGDLRETGKKNVARLRTRLEKEGISWDVRLVEVQLGDPARMAAVHARYSDLAIVAAPNRETKDADVARRFFSTLLFESGRPVLVVPARHSSQPAIRHAVVAWRPTRETARALHDALPFLTMATSVDVVRVDAKADELDDGEDPGVDIAVHLARHGLQVNVVSRPAIGGSVANTLLKHAAESSAQLIVAGGYGHSRAREWLLGGTTRELLHSTQLPVLFSH